MMWKNAGMKRQMSRSSLSKEFLAFLHFLHLPNLSSRLYGPFLNGEPWTKRLEVSQKTGLHRVDTESIIHITKITTF